ncbi:MAG: MBOAT family protein [Rhizobiales bacterium]|nr:MBOAT family protein [Hyphomicrobiales bacterium]
MSFTSLQFIFGFLPAVYIIYVLASRFGGRQWAISVLGMASLVFYAMFGAQLLLVLMISMVFNFTVGNVLACLTAHPRVSRNLLLGGIIANLTMLGYLKYTNFFVDVINQAAHTSFGHFDIAVPLGVSFFTFVQIGYLIDSYNGQLIKHDFARYIVFTAFFPAVTAGPLVMQREMMEQLNGPGARAFDAKRVLIGLTMFAMGLFKKVVMADAIAPFADQVFGGVHAGMGIDAGTAWIGALCYALQLYFDFSGYSDMAIGLATIFGIKLPLNFDSPFKSTNISDFWRRWHMTMTRFFTAYAYSGLAMWGMRKSMALRTGKFGRFLLVAAVPSIITFIVAGVWHGSGWTYVIYGVMHGLAIATYLGWREFSKIKLPTPVAWLVTMAMVVSGLVMFRAPDVPTAIAMLGHMWGFGQASASELIAIDTATAMSMIVIMGAVTLLLPNTQQILHHEWPVVDTKPEDAELAAGLVAWRPSFSVSLITACIFTIGITSIGSSSGFLYYKF